MGKAKKPAKAQAADKQTECRLCELKKKGDKLICTECAKRISSITSDKDDKFNVALTALIRNGRLH